MSNVEGALLELWSGEIGAQSQFIHHIFIDHVSHTVDPVKSKYVSAGSAISAGTMSPVQHF